MNENALFLLLIKKWLQQFRKTCCYQDFSLDFWCLPGLASISDSGSFYTQQSGSWEKSCQAQLESGKMDNIEENGSNVDPLNSSSSDQGTSVSSAASNIVQLISQQNAHQVGASTLVAEFLALISSVFALRLTRSPLSSSQTNSPWFKQLPETYNQSKVFY